ncbi:MAG TPA: hypothetical protein VNJ01_02390 [Bacteriovoracaceae bacterium]|nr:hypothetical protein [Bacteriovoracaceae bacterium]
MNSALLLSVCLTGLIVTFHAQASDLPGGELQLSESSKVSWTESVFLEPVYAPSFGTFILQGRRGLAKFTGQVRRIKALGLATPIGVNKEWSANLKELHRLEKPGEDLGCKKVASGVFTCLRTGVSSSGQFVEDQLHFNRDREVIYLRISSKSSKLDVQGISDSFKIDVK